MQVCLLLLIFTSPVFDTPGQGHESVIFTRFGVISGRSEEQLTPTMLNRVRPCRRRAPRGTPAKDIDSERICARTHMRTETVFSDTRCQMLPCTLVSTWTRWLLYLLFRLR